MCSSFICLETGDVIECAKLKNTKLSLGHFIQQEGLRLSKRTNFPVMILTSTASNANGCFSYDSGKTVSVNSGIFLTFVLYNPHPIKAFFMLGNVCRKL